jgi:hypothetical protein
MHCVHRWLVRAVAPRTAHNFVRVPWGHAPWAIMGLHFFRGAEPQNLWGCKVYTVMRPAFVLIAGLAAGATSISFTADFSQTAALNFPLLDCVGSGHGEIELSTTIHNDVLTLRISPHRITCLAG